MSKKQQTLFQSWHSGGKQQPEGNKPTKNCNNSVIDEVTLLDSDDDEGLEQAFEESLRNYYENEKPRQQTAQHADNKPSTSTKSSSSYFDGTAADESSIVDTLPGFDNNSGNTWIYPTNKPVRKYQRDIVETCIFHNTLVTLPTGLGKFSFFCSFVVLIFLY
jgi:Fanconi anemia group M protein